MGCSDMTQTAAGSSSSDSPQLLLTSEKGVCAQVHPAITGRKGAYVHLAIEPLGPLSLGRGAGLAHTAQRHPTWPLPSSGLKLGLRQL